MTVGSYKRVRSEISTTHTICLYPTDDFSRLFYTNPSRWILICTSKCQFNVEGCRVDAIYHYFGYFHIYQIMDIGFQRYALFAFSRAIPPRQLGEALTTFDFSHCSGVLLVIESAWTPVCNSRANNSLINRCLWSSGFPLNSSDITITYWV